MKSSGISSRRGYDQFLVFIVVMLILLSVSPLAMPFVRRDSGVFLYGGWRILNGEAPYRDFWDNKPPVIFYINAAGLAIAGGSRWGVWLIELVFLSCAAWIGFALLKRTLGRTPALLSIGLWALALVNILSGGNYATEYTLPIQFTCLWLAYQSERKGRYSWRGYWIGFLCGLAFFTKQNTIGIGIAISLYILFHRLRPALWKSAMRDLGLILLGAVTALGVVVIPLAQQGALLQLWDNAFVYNFVYSTTTLLSRIQSIASGLIYLPTLSLLALIGWGTCLAVHKLKKLHPAQELAPDAASLFSIGLIDLPIEVLLASFSGYSFRHYYLALLPIYTLFSGYSFWLACGWLSSPTKSMQLKRLLTVSLVTIFLISVAVASIAWIADIRYLSTRGTAYNEVIAYVEQHTSPDDFVLVWGAETGINYETQRRSPTRFVYQYPLYEAGYASQQNVEEFLDAIVQQKPRLIIDTLNSLTPIYDFGITSPRIEGNLQLLQSSYKVSKQLGPWTIYEYAGN
jgi:hypothetical protein